MAVISVTSDLDVLDKYNCLITESLGASSVYIRTKETLEELFKDNTLKSTDKSEIIASVLGNLNSSLVNASMATALQWASTEKDIELKKLELAKQLDVLDNQILLTAAQASKTGYESVAVQAQTERLYGTPTVVDGVLTALVDEGKVWYETEVLKQQDINLAKEALILDSKLNESYAAIHKVVADTYTNYGNFSYLLDASGLTSVTDNTPLTHTTLSSVQADIAKEQANGYAYNAWANALTGTSSMLGTAIASELTDFGPGTTGETLITNAVALSDKLGGALVPYTEYQGV